LKFCSLKDIEDSYSDPPKLPHFHKEKPVLVLTPPCSL